MSTRIIVLVIRVEVATVVVVVVVVVVAVVVVVSPILSHSAPLLVLPRSSGDQAITCNRQLLWSLWSQMRASYEC